jgi:hypothetical protein
MRAGLALALAAIMASGAALADVKRLDAVPESLWGKWAESPELCESGGKSVIEVSAKAYLAPEVRCTVMWVSEVPGLDGPIRSFHLLCPAAQQPAPQQGVERMMESNLVFIPTKDPAKFSVGADFDHLKDYQRCGARK